MTKAKPDTTGLDLTSRPGQPRWIAPKRLRTLGFKSSVALKDRDGAYLSPGQAMDAVISLNAMIEQWEAGLSVAKHPWAHIAPAHARPAAAELPRTSTGYLMDAYVGRRSDDDASWIVEPCDKVAKKPKTTQDNMRGFLHRLMEALAGFPEGNPARLPLPAPEKAERVAVYTAAMEAARSVDVSAFFTQDEKGRTPLQVAYDALAAQINPHTGQPQVHNANTIMGYVSAWLTWAAKGNRDALPYNPATDITKQPSPGRVVIWPQDKIDAVVRQAHADGWHSIAFVTEMALELSWSEDDLLKLRWHQLMKPGANAPGRVPGTRGKTGNTVHTTLTRRGRDLVQRMLDHYREIHGATVTPGPGEFAFLVDHRPGHFSRGAVGLPWKASNFRHRFIEVKRNCEEPIDDLTFRDLRDTAITRMKEAGLNEHQIQSRTHHTLSHIRNVIDKHYGMTTPEISDQAAELLDAYEDRLAARNNPKP